MMKTKEQAFSETVDDKTLPSDNLLSMYIKDVNRYPRLSPEEESEIFQKLTVATGVARESLKERIVTANLKLVVKIAEPFQGNGLEFMDLIQEGNLGLMHAVDLFDAKRGCKFSTYATRWIKQYMIKAIMETGRPIRLPNYLHDKIRKILREKRRREQEQKNSSLQEIAMSYNIKLSEEQLYSYILLLGDTFSLDAPMGEEDDENLILMGLLEDKNTHFNPENVTFQIETKKLLLSMMDTVLNEREKDILCKRYGFVNRQSMTLEEVGEEYHLTRERIRQIEMRAIKKLQSEECLCKLLDL